MTKEIRCYLILSFDIGSEIFHEIKLPNCVANVFRLIASIAVYEELICLFHYDRDCGYLNRGNGIHGLKRSFHLEDYMESLLLLKEGNGVFKEKEKSSNVLDKGIEERSELRRCINQQGSRSRGRFFCGAMAGPLKKIGLP
ncbi:hypothetical protein ACSBR2_011918 [Camellia fascicularis]